MYADFLRRHLSFLRDEDLSCRKKGPKVPLTCRNEQHTSEYCTFLSLIQMIFSFDKYDCN